MSGSVIRLTLFLVVSSLPNYTVLQRPESIIQTPFKLKTNFLNDFMKIRDRLFPFSFSTEGQTQIRDEDKPTKRFRRMRPSILNITEQLLRMVSEESSNSLVKRKIASPVLENTKVQNFIREKMKQNLSQRNSSEVEKDYLTKLINLTISSSDTHSSKPKETIKLTRNKSNVRNRTRTRNRNTKRIRKNNRSPSSTTKQKPSNERLPLDKRKPETSQITSQFYHDQLAVAEANQPKKTSVPEIDEDKGKISFLGYIISTLTQLPIIGNVLKASVDPLYRPIVRTLQTEEAAKENLLEGEQEIKNWCFGILGCIRPSIDFYHPLFRPVNLPPYQREQIDTKFTFYSRNDTLGYVVPAFDIDMVNETSFTGTRDTKIIIHGFLNDQQETWILEMVRALLNYGDYNIINVGWSSGSHALYSQATANARVVALEIVRLLKELMKKNNFEPSSVHVIGHSLGAHMAGYVGANIAGIGRITGLDPAEPYFQYMPEAVRLDPSDANFVDVIHTDIDSFFAITGTRGFGLEQAAGHIDFYPNGGREQPGCNQLLATLPHTLISEGADIVEGMNAGQAEIMNCDHIRAPKLFTDSLTSECPYLSFKCPSYKDYKEGKCFKCGKNSNNCASMGINADQWHRGNRSLVKMFLDTSVSPHFCKYHYLLTIYFNDTAFSAGNLRGRLKVSLITEEGNLRKFDLTSMSPMRFPRRGSRTFMLEHYEDLSGSQEALLNWTFESDLLDPLTFCVLFCKADLSVSSVTITSIDTPKAADRMIAMESNGLPLTDEIIMCHKKGNSVVSIPSESTVKIAASTSCPNPRLRFRKEENKKLQIKEPTI